MAVEVGGAWSMNVTAKRAIVYVMGMLLRLGSNSRLVDTYGYLHARLVPAQPTARCITCWARAPSERRAAGSS